MNEQLRLLIRLQDIDSAILSINGDIDVLPKKLERSRARLKDAKTSFERVKLQFDKVEKEKKQKESDLEDLEEKINQLKGKSAEIKTNKEYEAHLKGIQSMEEKRDKMEEEILSAMEVLDNLVGDVKIEEENIGREEEDYRKEEKVVEEQRKELTSKIEVFKDRRKDVAGSLDQELYRQYMGILKSTGGSAIVETRNEVCLGCHTNIPPQLFNDIKNTDDIYTCYHCNRFLYYRDAAEVPGVKGSSDQA